MATCSFCNANLEFLFRAKDINRKVSPRDFDYLRCPVCRMISIASIPDDLGDYYPQEYHLLPTMDQLKRRAKGERFRMDMIKEFKTSGTLLEVGSSIGVFAYQAKEAGFEVDTIEREDRCCDFLKNVVGVSAVHSDVPQKAVVSMRQHDVIAMWHVLEHLPDPWECLKAMVDNLSLKGILVIAMPNPDAFQFKVMGTVWPHLDAPRHLNFIPIRVLEGCLKKHGLDMLMVTTNDMAGKRWNRVSWQIYLMNRFRDKWMQRICFVLGYFLSFPMAIWDRRGLNGCTYTAIFQKKESV